MEMHSGNEKSFVMTVGGGFGRMKYLLLTMVPPVLVMYLILQLMNRGVLPHSRILGLAVPIAAMCLMLVIGWFLIFRKTHTLTVEGSTISEKNMMSNRIRTTVSASQIRSVRRNLLGEWLLKDENGKTLLCVESNMSERDLLEVWLASHGLTVE